jgi:hypothetical protein
MIINWYPRIIYINPSKSRKEINLENNNKAGIYIWINLINNKFYIGSGKN